MSTQRKNKPTKQANSPALIAWQVDPAKGNGKAFWRRIGAAWPNKAGGFQLRLNAMPLGGDLVLHPPREGDPSTDSKGAA